MFKQIVEECVVEITEGAHTAAYGAAAVKAADAESVAKKLRTQDSYWQAAEAHKDAHKLAKKMHKHMQRTGGSYQHRIDHHSHRADVNKRLSHSAHDA